MIFMCVGEHDTGERLAFAFDEGEVGKDDIDAGLGVIAELDTQINHQPFTGFGVTGAIEIAIHPDLTGAAERQEHEFAVLQDVDFGLHVSRLRKASISENKTSPPWMVRCSPLSSLRIKAPSAARLTKVPSTLPCPVSTAARPPNPAD